MLEVAGLAKTFGGVNAVVDVDFEAPEGKVCAVIGPNGAGKTTLFNLISGVYAPTVGSIRFRGEEVGGLAPETLAARGLSRTFQNLQVCMNLSAVENVMIGAHLRLNSSLIAGLLRWPGLARADREARELAVEAMKFVGCGADVGAQASEMPYGALKRMEIARALVAEPRMLLLDEPAAGLNPTETREIEALIGAIAGRGITVLLVEHDMKLVMGVSDHILVLHYGRKLAEGAPAEIRANPAVIAAYLGGEARKTAP